MPPQSRNELEQLRMELLVRAVNDVAQNQERQAAEIAASLRELRVEVQHLTTQVAALTVTVGHINTMMGEGLLKGYAARLKQAKGFELVVLVALPLVLLYALVTGADAASLIKAIYNGVSP